MLKFSLVLVIFGTSSKIVFKYLLLFSLLKVKLKKTIKAVEEKSRGYGLMNYYISFSFSKP